MNFINSDNVKGPIISANLFNNVDCLIHTKTVIRHLHITGKIIGYVHSFCHLKVTENKNQISIAAHNFWF